MFGETITSLQNPRVKRAAQLRDRRDRAGRGEFLLDGAREILRAAAANVEFVEAFVCPRYLKSDDATAAAKLLVDENIARFELAPAVFDKLAFGDRREGVIAVARTPQHSLDAFPLSSASLIAVLEGIEKPGNVGAILRTADAAGLDGVVVCDAASDLYNPNCIRASAGTLFSMPLCATTTAAALPALAASPLRLYAARVDGKLDYTEVDFTKPSAIVLGSEAHGLTDAWNGPQVTSIRLPQYGIADSLNVSVTAAVLFYEAVRQRRSNAKA